ncbi:glycine betaine/carnitine/choline-binding protein [Thermacetogenium phaeum DSM 12270]|uniref:Glycine betaine/carnitine/choline-binding protein n=1 Tax=Thermacetogenium phaeum (strain ATCC BAA-254 / DSM 26808 / PB) TaxID=1089553 RepID=K4LGS9_THEPS|nr:glycine betaine ABC transporter substrate-binding protein [Thermacetogenium phaeum]AFV12211.1 glycine betaine/carnitine/choline-binding protein [Thermacetogenium phaeum DSM 12270]
MMKWRKSICWAILLVFIFSIGFVGGCGKEEAQTSEDKIVIASKQFAESYILAHMAAILLKEKAGLDVDTSKIGMGATELLHPALVSGQIDLYPEYTGTAWMVVLKQPVLHDREEIYNRVKEDYQDKFKIACLPPLGFQNTFAIAMPKEKAEELNITTISDLAKHPGLTLVGDSTTWTRPDVYPGLQKTYGLNLKKKMVDTNFFYEALAQGQGDVTTCFSTDGRLKEYNFTVLQDDKNFFPPYDAMYVVRSEILKKHPEIEEKALKPLFGAIDEKTMIDLNYQVEVEKKDPAEVAREFLKSKGLI